MHTLEDYVADGILAPAACEVLRAALDDRPNIVICGGTGSGKATLANALLRDAVELAGPCERFVILEDTVELQCTAANHVQLRTMDEIDLTRLVRATMRLRPDRIVIGEIRGSEALALLKTSLFFRLVSYRYGRGSILITTNKGVQDWPGVLAGDEVLATAILDRLLHRCHVLNISGWSYRLRELAAAASRGTGSGRAGRPAPSRGLPT